MEVQSLQAEKSRKSSSRNCDVGEFMNTGLRDISKQWHVIVGLIAMVILVFGTFSEAGSQLQKILFVIGAPTLGITAYAGKQKMFTTLQLVATLGAILAFFPDSPATTKYGVMGIISILSLAYLVKTRYFEADGYGLIGAIGLISIAIGYVTSPFPSPFWFAFFLGVGGMLLTLYSGIQFFHDKVKIALLWLILNIIFSINPILILIK